MPYLRVVIEDCYRYLESVEVESAAALNLAHLGPKKGNEENAGQRRRQRSDRRRVQDSLVHCALEINSLTSRNY